MFKYYWILKIGLKLSFYNVGLSIDSKEDPKELKRQRDSERYANMPAKKKNELLKRRREAYHANRVRKALENDNNEQLSSRNGEMGSTQSVMEELGGAPTEQGVAYNHFVYTSLD